MYFFYSADGVSLEPFPTRMSMSSRRLGFGLSGNAESFTVNVPRRRGTSLSKRTSLIARIYGYDKLPATLPKMTQGPAGELTATQIASPSSDYR